MSNAELVAVIVHPELVEGVQALMREVDAFRAAAGQGGEVDFGAAETSLSEIVAELECAGLARMLRSLDPTEERVEVDGHGGCPVDRRRPGCPADGGGPGVDA